MILCKPQVKQYIKLPVANKLEVSQFNFSIGYNNNTHKYKCTITLALYCTCLFFTNMQQTHRFYQDQEQS